MWLPPDVEAEFLGLEQAEGGVCQECGEVARHRRLCHCGLPLCSALCFEECTVCFEDLTDPDRQYDDY